MAVTITKPGNRSDEPQMPPPDMPLVGRCHKCGAEWECHGKDVQRATRMGDTLVWWMACPACRDRACMVYTRDSVMGTIITGQRDREINRRMMLFAVVLLASFFAVAAILAQVASQ